MHYTLKTFVDADGASERISGLLRVERAGTAIATTYNAGSPVTGVSHDGARAVMNNHGFSSSGKLCMAPLRDDHYECEAELGIEWSDTHVGAWPPDGNGVIVFLLNHDAMTVVPLDVRRPRVGLPMRADPILWIR